MTIDFNKLTVDPFEMGRFSMHYDGDTCLGITDHFLNNTYSKEELEQYFGTSYSLDEWDDVADEMGIDITLVPVFDVKGNLTDKTHADYVEGERKGEWTKYTEIEEYMLFKIKKLLLSVVDKKIGRAHV